MTQLIVDLDTADEDMIKKSILFLSSFLSQKPKQFTDAELKESEELMADAGQPAIPANPFAPGAVQQPAQVVSPAREEAAPVAPSVDNRPSPAVNPHLEPKAEEPEVEVEVDKAGYPWDARIHATTKTKTTKGVWKLKRGVDKELVKQVQAELMEAKPKKQLSPETQAAFAEAHAANPVDPGNPPPAAIPGAAPAAPSPFTPPADNVVPMQQPQPAAITWPDLLQRITAHTQAGTFNQVASEAFLNSNGITGGLALLASRPDLFESYVAQVGV